MEENGILVREAERQLNADAYLEEHKRGVLLQASPPVPTVDYVPSMLWPWGRGSTTSVPYAGADAGPISGVMTWR